MYIRKRFKKSVIYFLIFVIALSNFAALFSSPRIARAAAAEPNFDFSTETWEATPSAGGPLDKYNTVTHKITYTQEGKQHTAEFTYVAFVGEMQASGNGIDGRTVLYYKINLNYKIDGQENMLLPQNAQYGLVITKPFSDETKYKIWGISSHVDCNQPYEITLKIPDQNDTCINRAIGGTDSFWGWYIQKINSHLASSQVYLGTDFSPYEPPDHVPQVCADMMIAPASWNDFKELNDLAKEIGLEKSPFQDANRDLELYNRYYASSVSLPYSDAHFNYGQFLDDYQIAAQAISSFWKSGEGETWFTEGVKMFLGIELAAGTYVIGKQGVNALRAKGSQIISKLASQSAYYSTYTSTAGLTKTSTLLSKTNIYLLVGTAAIIGTQFGIDKYKDHINNDAWSKMFQLIDAQTYATAHIAFHECMVNNNVKGGGFTAEILDKEIQNYEQASNLINQALEEIMGYQEELNNDTNGTCGLSLSVLTKGFSVAYWLSLALCGLLQVIGEIAGFLTNVLFTSVFNAFHSVDLHHIVFLGGTFISKAHAADTLSPLQTALTNDASNQWPWVISAWKFVLVLTNLFLVVLLLFLGIVNILHIQYDTYNLKKMLPLLIVGVILANFSLLIMRMLIDASNILTQSFMGGKNPGDMVTDLINAVKIDQTHQGFWSSFADAWKNVGILLVAVVFGLFAMAGFLILGFMFYIRYAAVVLLAIAAPLAFIAMAFPPTQSIFKQWWGWTTKMIFMKPIAFFLLFIALQIKVGSPTDSSGATTSIVGWMIITVLVYFAILVPWKLGGAVMAFWGGVGGTIFGTKKGGWARKPVEDWWGRRKTAMGNAAFNRLPWLKRLKGAAELDKEMVEGRRKQLIGEGTEAAEKRMGDKAQRQRELTEKAERDLKKHRDETKRRIMEGSNVEESDQIRSSWWARWRYRAQTGAESPGELAYRLAKSTVEAQRAAEAVSTSAKWDLFAKLSEDMNLDQKLRDDLKILLSHNFKELDDIDVGEIEVTGTLKFNPDKKVGVTDYEGWTKYLREMADQETDETKKTNLLNSATEIERRAQAYRANPAHRPIGLAKLKYNEATGELEFDENQNTNTWVEYRQYEDQLRLEAKTVAARDPEKARKILAGADEIHRRTEDFQNAHQTYIDANGETVSIHYDHFLDRNLVGRQLSLLTPLLIGEMHTNAQNENIDSFITMLTEGGGFGNIRYMRGQMEKFVRGDFSELSANTINACISVLGGVKERINMSPDRSDAQELLHRFMGTMTKKEFLGPEFWKKMLLKLEGDRKGTLGEFVWEYTRGQKSRGENQANWVVRDIENFGNTADLIAAYTPEQLIEMIPVDVIGRLVPTSRAGLGRHQSEFYRRVVTQIMQMPEFGGGKNPAMFAGQISDRPAYERFSSLKPRPGGEEAVEQQTVTQQNQAAQQAANFASRTPEQIVHQAGGVDQALNNNYREIRYIIDMKPGLATKLIDGDIDINSDEFNTILDQLANLQPNIDHAQLQAELARIAPNLRFKLDSNIPVATYIENARIVRNGERTVDTLVRESVSSDYVPYVQAAPQNTNELSQTISSLEGSINRVQDIISDMSTSGRSMTRSEIDELKDVISQTPPGRLEISRQSILDNLESGNAAQALNILEKTLTGYRTAQKMPIEDRSNEEKIKRGIMAGFEAEWIRDKQRRQPTPPTAPTPTTPTAEPKSTTPDGSKVPGTSDET